jgi:ribosomal protein S12 methylthiotransferase accessory factor
MSRRDGAPVPFNIERLIGTKTGLVDEVKFQQPDRTDPRLPTTILQMEFDGQQIPAGGKGETRRQALLSAFGELAERYTFTRSLPRAAMVEGSFRELSDSRAVVDWEYLTTFGEHETGLPGVDDEELPTLSRDTECFWIPGKNLLSGEEVFVPAQLLFNGITREYDRPDLWSTNSSGFAAGPSLEFALVNAIYEVIERDAIQRTWWTGATPRPVDVSAFPAASETLGKIEKPLLDVELFELVSDVDVPTLGAALVNRADEFPKFLCSGGASLTPENAVMDVVLEISQHLPSSLYLGVGSEEVDFDDAIPNFDRNVELYAKPEHFEHVEHLVDGSGGPPTALEEYDDHDTQGPAEELEALLETLAAADCTPIALEVTAPDIAEVGLTVVHVLVPELVPLGPPSSPPTYHPAVRENELVDRPHPFP